MDHNEQRSSENSSEDLLRNLRRAYEEIKSQKLAPRAASHKMSAAAEALFPKEKPGSRAWRIALVKMDEAFEIVTEIWDGIRCVPAYPSFSGCCFVNCSGT